MRYHFKNLKIWQVGMDLVVLIYSITKYFPKEEKYGLVSQINRSVTSIPSNIAEGSGKTTDKEFIHFLNHALASTYELETQLMAFFRIEYLKEDDYNKVMPVLAELEKMIIGFINKVNQDQKITNCLKSKL